ncbi:MAG: trpG [Gammaproteobacteria bacterium]|jgi:anthranilate synthase component 2|nr:trpG [Gammaproteobacteria bacterium]
MLTKKLIIIDHYDSFTYTIKNYFDTLGAFTEIIKNDDARLENLEKLTPAALVLSPGPGHPSETGYTLEIIKKYHAIYPMLGICLGHQSLAYAFGGRIMYAPEIMHGKQSKIFHTSEGLFAGLPNEFSATRYHSLVVDPATLPKEFKITAWAYDKVKTKIIMAFQHQTYPLFGIQYHPEAILTEHGYAVLKNFIDHY